MMRCIDYPTMLKDGSGWGAMTGVSAGLLARGGFTGAPAVTVEGAASEGIWSDLGTTWLTAAQDFKPYAVCYWAQCAIAGALALQRDHHLPLEAIETIQVFTFREAAGRLAAPRVPLPATGLLDGDDVDVAVEDQRTIAFRANYAGDQDRFLAIDLHPGEAWMRLQPRQVRLKLVYLEPGRCHGAGDVVLRDSLVADNVSTGPLASDADGAGIYAQQGTLTLDHATVTGNRVDARGGGWEQSSRVVAEAVADSAGRVSFNFKTPDDLGGEHRRCARPVVDDHLLTERLRKLSGEGACRDIGGAARRKPDDHTYGSRWILLSAGACLHEHKCDERDG